MSDQLEIIKPTGEIEFVVLDPARGLTNIGRHPDNDVVVDSPTVADFHAVLDHRERPFRLLVLSSLGTVRVGGQPVTATQELGAFDVIELDGYTLMLVGADAPAGPTPAAPAHVPPAVEAAPVVESPPETQLVGERRALTSRAPDIIDEAILIEVPEREFTVGVDEQAVVQVNIVNGGSLVATFSVQVDGIEPDWVSISPPQVNLYEGERTTVVVAITPPRSPSSRAGDHHVAIRVLSPNYPGRHSQVGVTLTVLPFYEFTTGELSPREQTISYRKRSGTVSVALTNRGNSHTAFRIDGSDTEQKLEFEFHLEHEAAGYARQAELPLAPAESQFVTISLAPISRRLIALRKKMHSYTVSATPVTGLTPPRSLLGTAYTKPLIGPFTLLLIALTLATIFVLIFRPSVGSFDAEVRGFAAEPVTLTSNSGLRPRNGNAELVLAGDRFAPVAQEKILDITAGESVTLRWDASRFSTVRIEPDIGEVDSTTGSLEVSPPESIRYTLSAENFLSRLLPGLFKVEREIIINVEGVDPVIRFSVDKENILVGERVAFNWDVANADELVLLVNGAPETLGEDEHIGSRVFAPEFDTVYTLRARNRYTSQDGITKTFNISVAVPTPTPLPPPIVERFNVLPAEITEGDKVELQWTVANVEAVSIDPLGEFPPEGSIEDEPSQTTSYVLRASNGRVDIEPVLREVVVNPAPTATPVPGAPIIEFFTASPNEVDLGSTAADAVVLTWSVVPFHQSDTVAVQLSGPNFGIISGLPVQGSQTIAVDEDTQVVLTAANDDLSVSQSVEVKVNIPAPVITALSPSTSTQVGASTLSMTITGSSFVSGASVQVNGVDRSTTFVSSTQLTATLITADLADPATLTITVKNPASAGGAVSNGSTFILNNPVPVLSSVTASSATAGDPDTIVSIGGSSFVKDSAVRFNGTDRSTTFGSSTSLTAIFKAADLSIAGTYPVSVFNPEPGGGSSGVTTFTVNNPVPTITTIGPPSATTVGGDTFQIVINGTGYVDDNPGSPGTTVAWNGEIIPAVFNSDTQLTATVDKTKIATATTVTVTVTNASPGGGTSGFNYVVGKDSTTTTVSASVNPARHQQGVIFTFEVKGTGNGTQSEPTGTLTITIKDNASSTVSTLNLAVTDPNPNSVATPFTNTVTSAAQFFNASGSPYTVTAAYSGDGNFAESTSTTFTLNVDKADTTLTWISVSPSPGTINQNVAFQVQAAPVNPAGGTVDGTIRVREGTTTICDINLASGDSCSGTFSSLGTHNLTAIYPAPGTTNSNYNGSESSPFSLQVKETPSLSISSSPGLSATYNAATTYTYTATLTGNGGTPAGSVTFTDNNTPISGCAPVTLAGGVASCSVIGLSATPSTHTIKVDYPGAGDFNGTNTSVNQVVNKANVIFLVSPTADNYCQDYSLGAACAFVGGVVTSITVTTEVTSTVGTPTGSVTLTGNETALPSCGHSQSHTINRSFGVSSTDTTFNQSDPYEHNVTFDATYNGDNNFNTSTVGVSYTWIICRD